jgi:hypothetical protein
MGSIGVIGSIGAIGIIGAIRTGECGVERSTYGQIAGSVGQAGSTGN